MKNPYRSLPPLGALIGFEAAARLGSFSAAAAELNMTQSAVSHQIRTLETHLGQPLFLRINRRVELTDAGRDLQLSAGGALEIVRQGVRRLEAYTKPGSVVLHMPQSLSALWFLPRLARLRAAHPEIEPWLVTGNDEIDLNEAEIEIAITRDPPRGTDVVVMPLMRDERVPLASPSVAEALGGDIKRAHLIHDEEWEDWQSWYLAAGLERADYAKGLNFSEPALALEAAARGLGVCLGSRVLAGPLLEQGRLVQVHDCALRSERVFHAVTLERNLGRDGVRALWNWLGTEAA